jgi:zinc protease
MTTHDHDAERHGMTRLAARLTALMVVAVGLVAALAPAQAADSNVLRATLDNGMRVILVRNTLAPVVSTSMNYLVGSDEAPKGFPGMAHAQEHMMFRGNPGLSADQLADIGSLMGGNFNADTQESVTQYLFTVPSEDLGIALHIEAARMEGVLDSEKDWDKERGAIEQEVAGDLSSPSYLLYSKLRAAMFAGTPYDHDALGTRPSFDKTTAKMLKEFHDTWYAPNNAILIVAGDLDLDKTMAEIKTLFSGFKRKKLPPRPKVDLQPVKATSTEMKTDRPVGTQMIAMRVPGLDSKDFPALEVLSDVLSSQRGDLYALVPEGKALGVGFGIEPLPEAGIAYVQASFPQGADPKVLDGEIRTILKKIIEQGVPPELVDAAKRQERSQAEFQKNSISGLASIWAEAVAVYGLKTPDEDLERIEKVTVADVNRVAKKYLDLDHAFSAVMLPEGAGKPTAPTSGFGGQENIALGEAKPTKLPDWAEKALGKMVVPPSTLHPVVSKLSNGITLIVQPEDVSDTISVYGRIKNRSVVQAPKGKDGVAQLLDALFSFGTTSLDRIAFQKALDEIGASEYAGTSFGVQVLSENFDRGVALLADNELHPALPGQIFKVFQRQLSQVAAARLKSPGYLSQRALVEALFPTGDPSLRQTTPMTVNALTLNDVDAYYESAFRPDLTTIVVIGKVKPEMAKSVIEKYFGGWTRSGPTPNTELPPAPPNKAGTAAVPDARRVQDSVNLAEVLPFTRSNPDYYALELGNAVLGGAFYSTRLTIDLRKNSGLVYSVGSQLQAGKTRSIYFVSYACDPENVTKAADAVIQELKNMQTAPVGDGELARVKALMLRQLPLGESSISSIAMGMIGRHQADLPLDEPTIAARHYIEIGPAEIQAAFKKWIRPDDLVRVSRGPAPG